MLGALKAILCAILALAVKLAALIVVILNLLIAALGALATTLVGALPGFPAAPSHPSGNVLSYANWFFPIGGLIAGFAVFVTLWTAFLLLRIALRWVKAI